LLALVDAAQRARLEHYAALTAKHRRRGSA